jgi:hypothetical protein
VASVGALPRARRLILDAGGILALARGDGVARSVLERADVARRAGELLASSGTTDAVDAIVAAEALMSAPALVLSSDPVDLARLLDDQPEARRIRVIGI